MKKTFCIAACLFLVAAILVPSELVVADDLFPPPWRGRPLTTLAEWEFFTPANPIPPDGQIPPVIGDGLGGAGPLASFSPLLTWDPFDGDGAWIGTGSPTDPPGQIVINLPNWIDNEPLKLVHIQMTVQGYFRTEPDGTVTLVAPHVDSILAYDPTGPTTSMLVQVYPLIPVDPTNGTFLRTELWKIQPNPDYERILINVPSDTLVDQLVIDTISFVPEPGTFGVMMLGMGVFLMRGRTRRS